VGEHRRAHKEALRKREKAKRLIAGGTAAVALAASVGVGLNMAGKEKESSAPAKVEQLLDEASRLSGDDGVKEILNHPYKEVLTTKVGDLNLTIAEIGDIQGMDYEHLVEQYKKIQRYLNSGPMNSVHLVTEYDHTDTITAQLTLEGKITAINKDIRLFVVEPGIDLGPSPTGFDIFTEQRTPEVLSFISSSYAVSEGAYTEALQGMVSVTMANSGDGVRVNPNSTQNLTMLMQEQFANSIADMMAAANSGADYNTYQNTSSQNSREVHTDRVVVEGSFGYGSRMPYVYETAYNSYQSTGEIPANIGRDFSYPPLNTTAAL
jgi:hypothetical protein